MLCAQCFAPYTLCPVPYALHPVSCTPHPTSLLRQVLHKYFDAYAHQQ